MLENTGKIREFHQRQNLLILKKAACIYCQYYPVSGVVIHECYTPITSKCGVIHPLVLPFSIR